jgi:hypothetical protein
VPTLHTGFASTHANVGSRYPRDPPALPPWGVVGISRESIESDLTRRSPGILAQSRDGASSLAISPWHTPHKGALLMRGAFQGSGTLLELVNLEGIGGRIGGGSRGIVGDLPSRGSHRRFCQAMAGVPWDSLRSQDLWVTVLTYHGVPRDGAQVRADKKAFMRRIDRILGDRGKGLWGMIWVKEFQERGSWHLHGVMHTPYGALPGFAEMVRDAWLAVIGESQDKAARLHGVQCSQAVNMQKVKGYLSKYMGKSCREGAKAYQKRQPRWFKNGGRWWGIVGHTLSRAYKVILIHTLGEFVQVKRLLRSYVRSVTHGRYTPKPYRAMNGQTVLGHGADCSAWESIARWIRSERVAIASCAIACAN